MDYSKLTPIKWAIILGLSMAIAVSSHAQVEKFTGRAINTNGELEFIEEHSVKYRNGQVTSLETIYFDTDYNKIGEIKSHVYHDHEEGHDHKDGDHDHKVHQHRLPKVRGHGNETLGSGKT